MVSYTSEDFKFWKKTINIFSFKRDICVSAILEKNYDGNKYSRSIFALYYS
jgi:hypothetical protein